MLLLEPVVQDIILSDLVTAIKEKETTYINFYQLSDVLKIRIDGADPIRGQFLSTPFTIDQTKLTSSDHIIINDILYLSTSFYEKQFNLKISTDPKAMQIIIDSSQKLPTTIAHENRKRQKNIYSPAQSDSFSDYTFDNRFWTIPVLDFSFQKGFAIQKSHRDIPKHTETWGGYEIDFGMLFGGMDLYGSIWGDNSVHHYDSRTRLTLSRKFLEDPPNELNLKVFEIGDLSGINATLFNSSSGGRGMTAGSFKDLVLAADKTINLSGPLSEGWQVELYQNDQLIGFRSPSVSGQYLFQNIPVVYGLNEFKFVFYGPYGEIQERTERYYSGTSPVKKGEFGYYVNAYQQNRYLFEHNEDFISSSDKATIDINTYYGLTDRLSLMFGMTSIPNILTEEKEDFTQIGFQQALSGFSFQYNALYGINRSTWGHHFNIEGNIYIGDIFARYDYYGKLESPVSYNNGDYLKDLKEIRLSGLIKPLWNLPYFLDYTDARGKKENSYKQFQIRLSPSFLKYYNITLEKTWYQTDDTQTDTLSLIFQAQFDKLGFYTQLQYQLAPINCLYNLSQQINYRFSRYTYLQGEWTHNFRSQYSTIQEDDLDFFSFSAGQVFDFGNITFSISTDTDRKTNIQLTYQMSLGKVPEKAQSFSNPYNSMGQKSAIYATVEDEKGNPVSNAELQISGYQEKLITDENGEVLIPDISPYERTQLILRENSLEDISLIPEKDVYNLVLRPGTVYPVKIVCTHKGSLEGLIETPQSPLLYLIDLVNESGKIISTKIPQADGSFIFDEIPYGQYLLSIKDAKRKIRTQYEINITEPFTAIKKVITIKENP